MRRNGGIKRRGEVGTEGGSDRDYDVASVGVTRTVKRNTEM